MLRVMGKVRSESFEDRTIRRARTPRPALPIWVHLALFALAIVLPLWALLGVLAWKSVREGQAEYQRQAMVVVRNLALELDRELGSFGAILRTLATSDALQDGEFGRFQAQAAQVVPPGSAIVLRDRSGQQLVNTLFPFGTPLPVTRARAVLAADECVFRTRATCVSDLYTGTTDPQPYVLLDAPVMRDGEVAFALNIAVRAQHLATLLEGQHLPAGWAVSIADRDYRIVARWPEHDRFVGTLANGALRAKADADEGTVRTVNIAGVPVWGAFVRLPAWAWRVAIGVPETVLSAPMRRSLLELAAAGLLAVGLSLLAAVIYGRRLARPIRALTRMAGEVGSSPVAARVDTSIRELDQVSATLAEAGARLRASIAERDRAQAEQRRLNEELRARVEAEVVAREDAQARLAQSQRLEALGQLAGGIAHDFNNVLQAVQGGARLIQAEGVDAARVRRLAAMIADAASRGAAITRRLLTFARRADLRAEPIDANELLGAMRELLRHTLGAGIEVRLDVAPGVPPLFADRGQLETVLVNLAANARDAMAGAGVLTLSAAADSAPAGATPGVHVRLSLTDTGSGMDAATLARATEPFFTTKPRGQGTGLGLAMARGFADQSGGALHIESEPGRGTTVHLWLPVAAAPAATAAPAARPAKLAEARRRILLVDDEALVRALTAEGLEEAGFSVLQTASGADALRLLEAGEEADLVISDLSMPGMDGLTLIRETQRRRPGMPAILLTGFAEDLAELAVGGPARGAFVLLRKPIDARLLAERAAAALKAEAAPG